MAKSGTEAKDGSNARSLLRAIRVLDHLGQSETGRTAAEIVAALGLPRSTAYEILGALTEAGLLEQAPDDSRFRLGPRLFELGMHYRSQDRLLREGSRVLGALRDQTGETAQLSILEVNCAKIVLKEEGHRALRIISTVGTRVPVNWSAAGRLLVSDLGDAALEEFLSRTIAPSPTGRAQMDVAHLAGEIRRFRTQGHAMEVSEANEHAGCVAAPVLSPDGRCIAAVSLAVPEPRLASQDLAALVDMVKTAAQQLTALMEG